MEHLRLELRLILRTAFHTTGNRRRWGADKALAMSADGRYVIPATTLKGVLRDRAEALLRVWGQPVCTGPMPETMCADLNSLCLACQVFGHPQRPSPLRFQDGHFAGDVGTLIRSGVSISRQRHATLPHRLFFVETTEPGPLTCLAICEGYFPDRAAAYRAAALVALAVRWISAIGGGRTRGLGWLERGEVEPTLNDNRFYKRNPIPQAELEALWRTWSGGSNVAEG